MEIITAHSLHVIDDTQGNDVSLTFNEYSFRFFLCRSEVEQLLTQETGLFSRVECVALEYT
jgi:hypothetical protein